MLSKMDNLVRDFFLGFKADSGKQLYPRSWNSLCSGRKFGGLGFCKFEHVNRAFVAKLGWNSITNKRGLWIFLIKSKYIRGRKLLSMQNCPPTASWIMQSIWECKDFLVKNISFKLGSSPSLLIFNDPWIPSLPGFSHSKPPL